MPFLVLLLLDTVEFTFDLITCVDLSKERGKLHQLTMGKTMHHQMNVAMMMMTSPREINPKDVGSNKHPIHLSLITMNKAVKR
jgi:hypothetical protein